MTHTDCTPAAGTQPATIILTIEKVGAWPGGRLLDAFWRDENRKRHHAIVPLDNYPVDTRWQDCVLDTVQDVLNHRYPTGTAPRAILAPSSAGKAIRS